MTTAMTKSTRDAATKEIGTISRGKYTVAIKVRWFKMPATAVLIAVEQKTQGVSPAKTNRVYGKESVLSLVKCENIRL